MDHLMCAMCNYTTNEQKNLMYQIVWCHRNDFNFHITCTFPGCFYSSKSWSGFKTHFSWKHQQKIDVAILEVPNQDAGDEISPSCNSQNSFDMHCANFALNLMTRLKIPATGVDTIIEEAINLIKIAEEVQHKDPNISVTEASSNFKTQKQRTSFLSRNCSYIPPEEIITCQSYKHKNKFTSH